MKRIVFLAAVSVCAFGAAMFIPSAWEKSLPSGTITEVEVVEYSEYVTAAGEVICDRQGNMTVSALIPENEIHQVETGQSVVITGNAFPDKEYGGTVKSISSAATKTVSGNVQGTAVLTEISFDDADEDIRPGYTAKVKIFVSDARNISVLPYEAIKADDSGNEYVYVFSNGVAVKKDILTGVEMSDGVEVINGITREDKVISVSEEIEDGGYIIISD